MGYRLDIRNDKNTIEFYGTKHYGYNFEYGYKCDKQCLEYPSYCFLKSIDRVSGWEHWDYGSNIHIILTAEQFKTFITLYSLECYGNILEEKEIKELLEDKGNKLLTWD